MVFCRKLCGCRHRRDPEVTRREVLDAAFQEIHRKGYQGTSLKDILARTGLTKGALYHHFPGKQALGYAVFDELIATEVRRRWIEPLVDVLDPIPMITRIIQQAGEDYSDEDMMLGCPLNNLAQEMSPLDEGFRLRINALYEEWNTAMATALASGQRHGRVREDIDPTSAATFLIAGLEGCIGMAKNAQSRTLLATCGQGVLAYLHSLQPIEDQSP